MDQEYPDGPDETGVESYGGGSSGVDAPSESIPVAVESDVDGAPGEEAALRRARALSRLLDDAVRVPGTDFRIGLDPVLGLVSGGGDAVAAPLALYPVAEAYRLDAPRGTIAKMLGLIALDFALGSIPILGTVFDAFLKANRRNVRALERHLEGT